MGPLSKFLGQLLAASVFLYFSPIYIPVFNIPFSDTDLYLSHQVSFIISLVWITGIINAINFIDGLDGLANGICFLASLTLFIINIHLSQFFIAFIYASVCGASLGFAKFNEYPAKIFLGDTGSLLWGYILSCLGLMSTTKSTTLSVMLIPLVTLGIPIFDVLIAIIRRSIAGENIFKADKKHIHHRLLQKGLTQQEAVRILYIICVILCIISFFIVNTRDEYASLIIIVLGLISFMLSKNLNLMWLPSRPDKNKNISCLPPDSPKKE
jgi:UDP-GlcNAc:undecaprenyl-phosphate GlcNAc-1-phosphate transferase